MEPSMTAAEAAQTLAELGEEPRRISQQATGIGWMVWGVALGAMLMLWGAFFEIEQLWYQQNDRPIDDPLWWPLSIALLAPWPLLALLATRWIRRVMSEESPVRIRDRWTWLAAFAAAGLTAGIIQLVVVNAGWQGGDGNMGLALVALGIVGAAYALLEARLIGLRRTFGFSAAVLSTVLGFMIIYLMPHGDAALAYLQSGVVAGGILAATYVAAGYLQVRLG